MQKITKKQMKKDLQIAQNKVIENVTEVALKVWHEKEHGKGKRLNSMQATIYEIDGIKFLVSYDTLAAFIIDGKGFDILRMFTFYKEWVRFEGIWGYLDRSEYANYSTTSGRQISTFFKKYGVNDILTYREV